jgi:membrane-bound lytic murein transglycosylase D
VPSNSEVTFAPSSGQDSCETYMAQNLAYGGFGTRKGLGNRIDLAGEEVPLNKPSVRRRLQREVNELLSAPNQTRHLIGQALYHFKTLEPLLKRYNIPSDFKYVVAIESQFETHVVSRRGATGMWQLMADPAIEMGLRVDATVDERTHTAKSTRAACRMLRMFYKRTGSWTSTLAAYNLGINRWERITQRVGHTDYYKMGLNSETNRYVFKLLALKELMENPGRYRLSGEGRSPVRAHDKPGYIQVKHVQNNIKAKKLLKPIALDTALASL